MSKIVVNLEVPGEDQDGNALDIQSYTNYVAKYLREHSDYKFTVYGSTSDGTGETSIEFPDSIDYQERESIQELVMLAESDAFSDESSYE